MTTKTENAKVTITGTTAKHVKDANRINRQLNTLNNTFQTVMQKYLKLGNDLNGIKQVFDADNEGKLWTKWVGAKVEDGAIRIGLKTAQKCMQLANHADLIEKAEIQPTSLNEAIALIQADKVEQAKKDGTYKEPKKTGKSDDEKLRDMLLRAEKFLTDNKVKCSEQTRKAAALLGSSLENAFNGKYKEPAKAKKAPAKKAVAKKAA